MKGIASQTAVPTFENTVEAMERAGQPLARVSAVFFNKASADATPAIQKWSEPLDFLQR